MRKRHIVVLSEEERAQLHTMIGRGIAAASVLTHARILLKANQGEAGPSWTDAAIAVAVEVNPATVARIRQHYVTAGLEAALDRKRPRASTTAGLTGRRRPTWSRWRAARHPRVASAGRCGCWQSGWWSWRSWRRCRMRRCGRP